MVKTIKESEKHWREGFKNGMCKFLTQGNPEDEIACGRMMERKNKELIKDSKKWFAKLKEAFMPLPISRDELLEWKNLSELELKALNYLRISQPHFELNADFWRRDRSKATLNGI